MATFTVLYDACVLYPAPLRDLLMRLALTDLFRAKWSNQIHDEWIRNVLKDRPDINSDQLERTRVLMNSHVRDCLVEDFETLIASVALPDPDDRHVLAAAIKGRSDLIVTFNLKDFPANALDRYGIQAQHPDEFITSLIDLNTAAVCEAVAEQRRSLKNPPYTASDLLACLEKQGLPESIARLRPFTHLL